MNIHNIFHDVDLLQDVNFNLKEAKEAYQRKLIPLVGEERSSNPSFIYISPKWEFDNVNEDRIIVKPPQDSFFSLYIICIFK